MKNNRFAVSFALQVDPGMAHLAFFHWIIMCGEGPEQFLVIMIIQVTGCDEEDDIVIAFTEGGFLGEGLFEITVLLPPAFASVLQGASSR